MLNKQELRKKMLAKRRAMSSQEAGEKSAGICRRLAELLQRELAETARPVVFSYLAYGREVQLNALHRSLWQLGWRLAVPRTEGLAAGIMEAAAYEPEGELIRTGLGVWEPLGAALCPASAIDAVLLPGVAFAEDGSRLGHGGGYYDRFLPGLRAGTLLVGVAYDWQVLAAGALPKEAWDRDCRFVVTEQRVIMA